MKVVGIRWSEVKESAVCLALCAMLFFLCVSAEAQQTKKMPQIGYLLTNSRPDVNRATEVVRQALQDLGYIEGRNIVSHYRSAEGKLDYLPELAAELVGLKVDVIVTSGDNGTRAAQKATTTIPIVMPNVGDPVEQGFVKSLAQPGGNITGLTTISAELSGKRLELIKELFPMASLIAVLWNPTEPSSRHAMREVEAPLEDWLYSFNRSKCVALTILTRLSRTSPQSERMSYSA